MRDDESGCLWIVVAAVFGLWFWIWGRDTSIRYQLEYSASRSNVSVLPKPKDCDFMFAPMGTKGCSYEKVVYVEQYALDVGGSRPVVSTDGGKTWEWNDGGPTEGASVVVSWRKNSE